jgi:hypothetical protein
MCRKLRILSVCASLLLPDVPVADEEDALVPEPIVSLVADSLSRAMARPAEAAMVPRTSTLCPT